MNKIIYNKRDKNIEFNNKDAKEWFLAIIEQELSESTVVTYEKLMSKVSDFEKEMKNGRDVCHFSRNEILEMLGYFRIKESSANTYISMLRRYIDFCMNKEHQYLATGINFADEIKSSDLRRVINSRAENEIIGLTYENIIQLVQQLKNARDKAMILGMFNLIRGFQFKDLINLKRENISWEDRTIMIPKENGDIRIIEDVDDYTLFVFDAALKEDIYYEDNGNIEIAKERLKEDHKKGKRKNIEVDDLELEKRKLIQNDYIIRPIYKKSIKKEETDFADLKIRRGDVYKVFSDIKEWTNKDWITSVDIYKAGFVNKMKKYIQKSGKESFTINDVNEFAEKNDLEIKNPYKIYKLYFNQLALTKEGTGK